MFLGQKIAELKFPNRTSEFAESLIDMISKIADEQIIKKYAKLKKIK